MEELVFCCPECLNIGRLGISADFRSLERSQHRPIFISCIACRRLNCVTVDDVLMTASIDDSGRFIPLWSSETAQAETW